MGNLLHHEAIERLLPLLKSIVLCTLQDLTANPKCSVLLARDPEDRTDLVITLHGDAIFVSYNLLFISQKLNIMSFCVFISFYDCLLDYIVIK